MLWALTFSVESSLVKLRAAGRNRTDDVFITRSFRARRCPDHVQVGTGLGCSCPAVAARVQSELGETAGDI